MTILQRMAGARFAARNIIQIKDPFDHKGNMPPTFDKGKIATLVGNFG
jgi:hypothetical protein